MCAGPFIIDIGTKSWRFLIICLTFADMNRLKLSVTLVLGVVLTALCPTSCSDHIPTPDEKLQGNTVIVYMGAENSLASYSQADLEEMRSAMGSIPEDCQVVVYRDAELKPVIYRLTNGKFDTWHEYKEDLNSGDMATMQKILRKIVTDFPSEQYSLVLWSHGTGWIDSPGGAQRSIIVDNGQNNMSNHGQWVHIRQLASVLETMPHLEYIFFDACYMQSVEVASYLYPFANHIIGSPTEIPAKGAPYHLIMSALCRADVQGIVNGYASGYSDSHGVLLSAIRSEEFAKFCSVTSGFIPSAFSRTAMPSLAGIQIYAPEYGADDMALQRDIPVPYDIRSAMYHTLSAEDYATWDRQWQQTVLYPVKSKAWDSMYSSIRYGNAHRTLTDPEHYGGLSMNIPRRQYQGEGWEDQFRLLPWYTMTLWEQAGW